MPKLSVTVITKDEAANLEDTLQSVAWADEIVVVDSESTDGTVDIARRFTDRVVVRPWPGYGAQKNHAATLARHDWILSVDADERVTPQLADAIRTVMAGDPSHAAFDLPRVTWHLGRWIRTTDWYPDIHRRLYNRQAAEWTGGHVHESLSVRGSVGHLTGELHHYPYRSIADHVETINQYTTYAARQMDEQGRRTDLVQMAAHPSLAFVRNYLIRRGIQDGLPGFVVSTLNAYYVFLKLAKLWELQGRRADRESASPNGSH